MRYYNQKDKSRTWQNESACLQSPHVGKEWPISGGGGWGWGMGVDGRKGVGEGGGRMGGGGGGGMGAVLI